MKWRRILFAVLTLGVSIAVKLWLGRQGNGHEQPDDDGNPQDYDPVSDRPAGNRTGGAAR